jgi:DNA-binding HxlR family transcriptional regulator
MNPVEHDACPVVESIDLLQEKWMLHIIRALLDGPRGFNELARAVGGVNTTTLAARLERLEREGIVTKTIESTMPPRTRYRLTPGGVELQDVIEAIDRWARTYLRGCRPLDPAAGSEARIGTGAAQATDPATARAVPPGSASPRD